MKKNVGNMDKTVRLTIALVLTILILTDVATGTWAIVAAVLAAIMVITALTNFCGLYTLLGINTCKLRK